MSFDMPNDAGAIDKERPQETPDLTEVAFRISKTAAFLKGFLDAQGFPYPSFAADAPSEFPNPSNEPAIQRARDSILEDTTTLSDLVLGPAERLKWTIWPVTEPVLASPGQDLFTLTLSRR